MIKAQLHILPTPQKLGAHVALYVAQIAAEAVAERGRFSVALSGGSLPKLLSPPLANEPLRSQIDWSAWHVFWADERYVSLDDVESNYYLAHNYLFEHVTIPARQIYPIDDSLNLDQTAKAYQDSLQQYFQPAPAAWPQFDLILLGLGEDGHTASLFPGHALLNETERQVAPIADSPKPPPERITLTLPLINNARHVAFLAAGTGKVDILAQVLGQSQALGLDNAETLPAARVQPTSGNLHWFVDQAAAGGLKSD